MRQMKRMSLIALLMAFALVAAACGGGDDVTDPTQDDGGEATGGEFSYHICEPQFLQPGQTQETCGAQVLNSIFDGLIDYDPDTAEPFNVIAESIESEDNVNWTIKIRDDWTFHNGEPVTAESFVNSWNWTANAANAALNNYFMDKIEGYEDLNPAKGKADPKAVLSGLEVVDDTTFNVTLNAPFSHFPLIVGYTAFFPLPEAFFDDPKAYNEKPIGNGPYQMDGKWKHDQFIKVKRYEDYPGTPGNADRVEFRIYSDVNTAYTDMIAGNLDIVDDIPTEVLAQAPDELGDRYIEKESSYFGYIGFPLYQKPWDKLELRQAVSMAMDREAITTAIFQGSYTPAGSIITPVVAGHRENVCGEICTHQPDKAKELWDANGGPDEITFWFNNDGGHEEWAEAFANQLRDALGVKVKFESLAFEEYLTLQDNHELTGPYRGAWVFDYPSPQNYLEPIFGCNGSSQEFGYEDHGCEEGQQHIDAGNQAESIEAGIESYQAAEEAILADLPATPVWYGVSQKGHSENVTNVIVDIFSFTDIRSVEVVNP